MCSGGWGSFVFELLFPDGNSWDVYLGSKGGIERETWADRGTFTARV